MSTQSNSSRVNTRVSVRVLRQLDKRRLRQQLRQARQVEEDPLEEWSRSGKRVTSRR